MNIQKGDYATISLVLTAYSIAVSVLYHFAFWMYFSVNIFQYMQFPELMISSIYPLLIASVMFSLGASTSALLHRSHPEGGGRNTKLGMFLNRHIVGLATTYIIIALLPLLSGEKDKYITTVVMLIPLFTAMISRYRLLHDIIEHDSMRRMVSLFLVALPFIALYNGSENALNIIDNKNFLVVKFHDSECEYKYLGSVGGNIFAVTFDNKQIQIAKLTEGAAITITNMGNTTIAKP